MARWSDETIERLDPSLTDAVSVGADLRTVYTYSPDVDHREGFFQMQSTFYACLQPSERFALVLAQGQSETREAFGLAYVLPHTGYIKVGRFTPAYGWKFEDHTHAVRDRLGFAPPAQTDVGVEAGLAPGKLGLQVSVTNGAPGLIIDNDHRLAGTLRVDGRTRIAGAGVALGGSAAYAESAAGVRRTWGFFGSVRTGPVIWLGEWDVILAPETGSADAMASSHEVTVDIARGLTFRTVLDFYDPDVNRRSGAVFRYGAGLDAFVNPAFGVLAMALWNERDSGPDVTGEDVYFQPTVIAHVLF